MFFQAEIQCFIGFKSTQSATVSKTLGLVINIIEAILPVFLAVL
jgi:hypothetical protein